MPFKTGVSISYRLLALPNKFYWFSKPDVLRACLPAQDLWDRELIVGLGQLNSQEEHFSCESPPICVLLTWGRESSLDHISTSPTHYFVALYIFICTKSFQLVFKSFSLIVFLQVVVILVCPCAEVSSRSSFSTVLILPMGLLISYKGI